LPRLLQQEEAGGAIVFSLVIKIALIDERKKMKQPIAALSNPDLGGQTA
jgi:hypothetical protein